MENDYKDFLIKQREAQSKFEYFLLGITLTFLLITFQMSNKSEDLGFNYILIIAWLLIIISVFLGIYRLRRTYVLYGIEADYLAAIVRYGKTDEVENVFNPMKAKQQKRLVISGYIQLYTMIIGFIFYLLFLTSSFYPSVFSYFKWNP